MDHTIVFNAIQEAIFEKGYFYFVISQIAT